MRFQYQIVVYPKSENEFIDILNICRRVGFVGLTQNSDTRNREIYSEFRNQTLLAFETTPKGIRVGYTTLRYGKTEYKNVPLCQYDGFLSWLRGIGKMDEFYG